MGRQPAKGNGAVQENVRLSNDAQPGNRPFAFHTSYMHSAGLLVRPLRAAVDVADSGPLKADLIDCPCNISEPHRPHPLEINDQIIPSVLDTNNVRKASIAKTPKMFSINESTPSSQTSYNFYPTDDTLKYSHSHLPPRFDPHSNASASW